MKLKSSRAASADAILFTSLSLIVFGFFLKVLAPIVGDTHEIGHVLVCHAIGGNVGGLAHWFKGVLPLSSRPGTDCLISGKKVLDSPMLWAGGAFMSIAAWIVVALIVRRIVKRAHGQLVPMVAALFLLGWSSYFWLELAGESYHAYAPPMLRQDSTQFVRLTHINPNFVASLLIMLLLISCGVALLTVYQGARAFWTREQTTRLPPDRLSA